MYTHARPNRRTECRYRVSTGRPNGNKLWGGGRDAVLVNPNPRLAGTCLHDLSIMADITPLRRVPDLKEYL